MCIWSLEGAISPLFHNIFTLDFHVEPGTRFSLRDKRLLEISEVEIGRVSCMYELCNIIPYANSECSHESVHSLRGNAIA